VKYGDRQLSVREETGKFQVIFDSGSSYTYLPNEIYENLVAAVSISNSCHNDQYVHCRLTLSLVHRLNMPPQALSKIAQIARYLYAGKLIFL
jgi:hypothetical protein